MVTTGVPDFGSEAYDKLAESLRRQRSPDANVLRINHTDPRLRREVSVDDLLKQAAAQAEPLREVRTADPRDGVPVGTTYAVTARPGRPHHDPAPQRAAVVASADGDTVVHAPAAALTAAHAPAARIGPVVLDLGAQGQKYEYYDHAAIHNDVLVLGFRTDAGVAGYVPPVRRPPEPPLTVGLPGLERPVRAYHLGLVFPFQGHLLLVLPLDRGAAPAAPPPDAGHQRGW